MIYPSSELDSLKAEYSRVIRDHGYYHQRKLDRHLQAIYSDILPLKYGSTVTFSDSTHSLILRSTYNPSGESFTTPSELDAYLTVLKTLES